MLLPQSPRVRCTLRLSPEVTPSLRMAGVVERREDAQRWKGSKSEAAFPPHGEGNYSKPCFTTANDAGAGSW